MRIQTFILAFTLCLMLLSPLFWRGVGGEAFAQITAKPDTSISICNPTCVTLRATVTPKDTIKLATSYKMDTTISYNAAPLNVGTKVIVGWKQVKGPFPIGFTFNFFGECYNEFYLGPGWMGFSAGQTGNPYTVPIPDTSVKSPKNTIMLSWCDIEYGTGGGIFYQVYGTAPYRRLAVSWYNMLGPAGFLNFCVVTDSTTLSTTHLQCRFSGQIILYETTNVIENYIYYKMVPSSAVFPNNGNANYIQGVPSVEGLHNKDGTKAVVVPGRNSVAWPDTVPTIWKDAVRFIPDGPLATYKLAWYKDTTLIASDTSRVNVCPTVTTTYTAKVIYTCPPDTFSDNVTVTVTGNSFTANAGVDSTICKEKNITLQATGGTKTSYSWTPTTSLNNPKIANPIATPTVTTSYIVTAYDSVCGNSNKDTVVITVDSVKATIAGKTSLCKGDSTKLIATGGMTYIWNTGFPKDTITVKPTANTTYSVTATNINSCTNTASVNVIVNPLPVIQITGKDTICSGDSTLLTASGGITYAWNTGNVKDTTATMMVTASVSTTYIVIGTNTFSCSDTDTITITVSPIPVTSITGINTLCKGDNTTLTASGGTTYLWNTGETTKSISLQPQKDTVVSVTAFLLSCTDTASVPITVNPIPTVDAGNDTTICAGNSVQLSAVGTQNFVSLQWTPTNGLSNSTIANPTATPDSTTQYIVQVANGTCVSYDTVVITINTIKAGLTPTPGTGVAPLNVNFINTTIPNPQSPIPNVYQWTFGDETTSNEASPSHIYVNHGDYTVVLIAKDAVGCIDTAIGFIKVNGQVMLWIPNAFTPNKDGKNEKFEVVAEGIAEIKIEIFNRWGEYIFESKDISGSWDGTFRGEKCQQDVYVCVITATGINGEKFRKEGTITLIR